MTATPKSGVSTVIEGKAGPALGVIFVATFFLILDLTVINVALNDMLTDLSMSFTDVQWVLDAYATSMAATLLLAGLLADRYGPRVTIVTGAVVFGLSSVIAALSTGADQLIVARLLQGIGAAALLASVPVLIVQNLAAERRTVGFAVFGGASGIALAGGPLCGGLLLAVSWEWIFWINVPAMILVAIGVFGTASRVTTTRSISRAIITSMVLGAAMFAIVYLLTHAYSRGLRDASILVAAVTAVAALGVFIVLQRSRAFQLFDMRLFASRSFGAINVVTVLVNLAVFPLIMLSVIYFEIVHGFSPVDTGLRLMVMTGALLVGSVVAMPIKGFLGAKHALSLALLILVIGLVLMCWLSADDSWTTLIPGYLVAGLGFGIFNPLRAENTVDLVPEDHAGMASGVGNTCQELGVACGVAFLGSVFLQSMSDKLGIDFQAASSAGAGRGGGEHLSFAFADSWNVTVAFSAVIAVVALAVWVLMAAKGAFGAHPTTEQMHIESAAESEARR